jgi:hypothetical protein
MLDGPPSEQLIQRRWCKLLEDLEMRVAGEPREAGVRMVGSGKHQDQQRDPQWCVAGEAPQGLTPGVPPREQPACDEEDHRQHDGSEGRRVQTVLRRHERAGRRVEHVAQRFRRSHAARRDEIAGVERGPRHGSNQGKTVKGYLQAPDADQLRAGGEEQQDESEPRVLRPDGSQALELIPRGAQ